MSARCLSGTLFSGSHVRDDHREAGRFWLRWLLAAALLLPAAGFAQGTVVAWGDGWNGQTNVPPGSDDIVAIAAGHAHSLIVHADGTVTAFGSNTWGERDVPAGLTGVTAVAGGLGFSLALQSDGTVVAWGNNQYLQAQVPAGLTGVTAIAAGMQHSLALKADGTVVAWGSDFSGQASVPGDLTGVTAIAAGRYHSLALKSDGTVVGWGSNLDGEIDIPPGLADVVAIATGNVRSMALRANGTVVVWGDLDFPNPPPADLTDVVAIAGGVYHGLALHADGTLAAWGFDSEGQVSIPAGLSGVTRIAAGSYHNLVLRNSPSPEDALRKLRDDVDGMNIAIGSALRKQLSLALAALAASNQPKACGALREFGKLALAQRDKNLTSVQADYLIAQANDIRELIGCQGAAKKALLQDPNDHSSPQSNRNERLRPDNVFKRAPVRGAA